MSNLLFPEMNEADAAKKCLLEVWPDCPAWLLSDEMDFVVQAMMKFNKLRDPTIKTDNTKVILHLESKLEKAKELLHECKEAFRTNLKKWQFKDEDIMFEMFNKITTFLESETKNPRT